MGNLSNEQKKMLKLLNEFQSQEEDDSIGNKKEEPSKKIEERFLGIPTNHDEIEEVFVNMINTSPKVRKMLENMINNVLSKSTIKVSLRDSFKEE